MSILQSCIVACRDSNLYLSNCIGVFGVADPVSCVFQQNPAQAGLDDCVVCNIDGLGDYPLTSYQIFDYLCNVYTSSGADAASSVRICRTVSARPDSYHREGSDKKEMKKGYT